MCCSIQQINSASELNKFGEDNLSVYGCGLATVEKIAELLTVGEESRDKKQTGKIYYSRSDTCTELIHS